MRARTAAQDAYIRALRRHALVFGTGPAGTGKTWLAVAHAVQLFERKEVDRIILSRPAVEAGERLGFLPGDMREKVDPYLRPIYDALYDLMDARIVERAMQTGEIEIAPLAFMRGRTLSNAVVILDEAQNTTSMQMKMFLTRLGENSRMIVTGDPSQVDLPHGQTSGLAEATRLLADVEGIGHVVFTAEDVIRHELVARIVEAYDARGAQGACARARPRNERAPARRAGARAQRPPLDILVESRALGGAARRQGGAAPRDRRGGRRWRRQAAGELAIVLTDDSAIRALNRDLARQGRADQRAVFPGRPRRTRRTRPLISATSSIAYETTAREADSRGKAVRAITSRISRCMAFSISRATITRPTRRREAMEAWKSPCCARLEVPNPYVARDRQGLTSNRHARF